MKLSDLPDAGPGPRRLAVGEFDGVHLGHISVITGCDSLLTFEPHPRAVVDPDGAPPLLTTLEQKMDALAGLGLGELIVARFDDAFSRMTPGQFIDDVLVGSLGATEVSVGANFRFGARASGDTSTLAADERFTTRVAEIVSTDIGPVSSSRIRAAVAEGGLEEAAVMLGRRFEMRGTVTGGDRRGRELGYPTANIAPDPRCVQPPFGIYSCFANGRAAVASFGVRPTFEGADAAPLLEVHLLDFDGDLYGTEQRVELISRIRPELRFGSAEELIAQMDLDAATAASHCASQSS